MKMETPLKRVRALGPAGHGGGEWWSFRLNTMAITLLSVWLLVSLLRLPQFDHDTLVGWLRSPIAAVPMLLLIATTFWHIEKGLREVIDDYAHSQSSHTLWVTLLAFFVYGGGSFAAFCVLKIALGAPPA